MEIIDELEPTRRGLYGGTVGYFGYNGNMDHAIAIRTLAVKKGVAHLGVGAGVVADSNPASEHQECMNKGRALLRAIELASSADKTL
jgi:anthranilate synthase component 1